MTFVDARLAGFVALGTAVAGAILAVACGSGPTISQVKGTVVQATFVAPVAEAVATAADGSSTRFAVADNGAFELSLAQGSSYRVAFVAGDTEVPLVFGGEHGTYAASLPVTGGGAVAHLGLVRGYDPSTVRASLNPPTEPGPACVDGVYEGAAEPCIGEPAAVICFAGDDSDDESEDDDGDHQCEDGIDPNGNDCDGGPAANADGGELEEIHGPVALPQYGLTVLACDEDEGSDDGEDDD